MKYQLNPFKNLEMFYSGMTRDEARQYANNGYEEFFKTLLSDVATDSFIGMDLHIYYSQDLTIKGIELFSPNQLVYKGTEFLGKSKNTTENNLRLLSINYSIEYGDIEAADIGLSFGTNDDQITSAYISLID